MPKKAPALCNYMGCPETTTTSYCDNHRTIQHTEYRMNRTDDREQAFYKSRAWIRTRDHKRAMNPLCEHCMRADRYVPVDDIDHITPIKVDWTRRLDLSNLQSLCRACHNTKSKEDKLTYIELR